jgi:uncharacterized membrane protein
MVDSADFDFQHSFLIISALFAASVLAIFYLSRLFVLALLVYREHFTPNAWRGVLMATVDWRKKAFGRQTVIVGCKWGTVAPGLFISFTVSFHLPEILGIRAHETWHDPFGFHFFSGYCASKCAPRFLCGRAHTGMLHLMAGSL